MIGDKILGDNNSFVTVQKTHRGTGELFEVQQNNGQSYVCNRNHILVLKNSQGDTVEMSVGTFLQKPKCVQNSFRGFKSSFDFPHVETRLDPYTAGSWLGYAISVHDTTFRMQGVTDDEGGIHPSFIRNSAETRYQLLAGILDMAVRAPSDTEYSITHYVDKL